MTSRLLLSRYRSLAWVTDHRDEHLTTSFDYTNLGGEFSDDHLALAMIDLVPLQDKWSWELILLGACKRMDRKIS